MDIEQISVTGNNEFLNDVVNKQTEQIHLNKKLCVNDNVLYDNTMYITNINKKLEEYKHDVLMHFNKRCVYCNADLFSGHSRTKLEYDHFWPISKGGQNIMWNILPACNRCNNKKGSKLPYEFDPEKYKDLCEYLDNVRNIYNVSVQNDIQKLSLIENLFKNTVEPSINDVKLILGLGIEKENKKEIEPEPEAIKEINIENFIDDVFDFGTPRTNKITIRNLFKMCEIYFDDYTIDYRFFKLYIIDITKTKKYRVRYQHRSGQHFFYMPQINSQYQHMGNI